MLDNAHRSPPVAAYRSVRSTPAASATYRDLTGVVLTADAMHTQDAHAKYLHRRGAHYVLIAKGNRPTLHRELSALPWGDVGVAFTWINTGHGRIETRTIKVVTPPRRPSFPHARQAIALHRLRRQPRQSPQAETIYAVTNLGFHQATPAQLADIIRGHWSIEGSVHPVHDVTFDEDRSQIRTGTSARVMALSGTPRSACTASPAPPPSPKPPARSCANPNASGPSSGKAQTKELNGTPRRSRRDQERNRPGPIGTSQGTACGRSG